MAQVCAFMKFLDENHPIKHVSELDTKIILDFEKQWKKRASYFKPIFELHPHIDWKQIYYSIKKQRVSYHGSKHTNILLDEDTAFSLAEFSEREHFQIVAFTMHRIDLIKKRRMELFAADAEPLAKIGCYLNDSYPSNYPCKSRFLYGRSAASRIRRLFDADPKGAVKLLHQNMLIMARDGTYGRTSFNNQVNSLRQSNSKFGKNLFNNYLFHLERLFEPCMFRSKPAIHFGSIRPLISV
jgi:hypothetical protein